MRILLIPTYISYSGMSLHVLALAESMKGRGHEVEVLSMSPGPLAATFAEADIPLTILPYLQERASRNPLQLAKALRYVRRFIREKAPDIVHTHGPRAHFFAGVAARGAGNHGLIATAHGSWTQFAAGQTSLPGSLNKMWKKGIYGGVDRLTARLADRMIAVSDATRDDLVGGLGIAAGKVVVVHNGIEEEDVSSADKAAVRNEFGLDGGDLLVACVGRLAYHKGTGYLAAAMDLVLSKMPGARFLLVGEGPMEAEMRRLAAREKMSGKVFVTGRRTDAVTLIAAADLLMMPSLSEGLPITLLEAAMTGTAMVATDTGGIAEIVINGETGLLCSVGDVRELAGAMISLLTDDQLREKMGAAARELWESEYTREKMVRKTEAVYREVRDGAPVS